MIPWFKLSSQGHHCANNPGYDGPRMLQESSRAHLGRGKCLSPQNFALSWSQTRFPEPNSALPSPRGNGVREGGHQQSLGSHHVVVIAGERFSHVLLQLQPDGIFFSWIKWKLSTKTFCPRGIQILNVLLITVCKTFREIYGNMFEGRGKIKLFLPEDVVLVSKLYESSCVAQFLGSHTVEQNGSVWI